MKGINNNIFISSLINFTNLCNISEKLNFNIYK